MHQLGLVLRAWRDRLHPAAAGVVGNGPRRAPGLRREELALLAGISIDYVVRLEQGRVATPSARVCIALARALQLSDVERAHLMRLAGHAETADRIPRTVPDGVRRIVEQFGATPVAVYDAAWELLHANPMFAATFGAQEHLSRDRRNMLIRCFESGFGTVRYTPEALAQLEESLVADLRGTTSRYPRDTEVAALVKRLERCSRFRELWSQRTVGQHETASKIVEHPEVGTIALDADVLHVQGADLRIVVISARPGSDARRKLDLLSDFSRGTPRRPHAVRERGGD